MLTTEKTLHPLKRHGTTQSERLLKSLVPENLQLDDRSIADVLAFAGKYAEQIRYWSSSNQPDGDWRDFWTKDTTSLFAIIAATDTDDLRMRYRNTELEFVQACKKEKAEGKVYCEKAVTKLYDLVTLICEAATTIQSINKNLPDKSPLKSELKSLISKLGIGTNAKGRNDYDTPLGKLISFHKGTITDEASKEQLLLDYGIFINEESWHLTKHDYIHCILYKDEINADDREDLWRLFLAFFKVLTMIVSKAEKAFQNALHGRHDHPPHIALFLSFVMLFRRYHQAEMNGLLAKHLVFYYRDILRLQRRREIPDRAHIIFEIAQNIDSYRLQKGTLLLGGKDGNGIDRLYAIADEFVINKAKLVEKQNLYFYKNTNGKITPIALPSADKKDGVAEPLTEGGSWHPLSGAALYKKLLAKEAILYELNKVPLAKKAAFDKELLVKKAALAGLGTTSTEDDKKTIEAQIATIEAQIATIKAQIATIEAQIAAIKAQRAAITAKPGIILSSPELWMDKSDSRTISITFEGVDLTNLPLDISLSSQNDIKPIPDRKSVV